MGNSASETFIHDYTPPESPGTLAEAPPRKTHKQACLNSQQLYKVLHFCRHLFIFLRDKQDWLYCATGCTALRQQETPKIMITNRTYTYSGLLWTVSSHNCSSRSAFRLLLYESCCSVTDVRQCLLPLGAEPFVFQFAIQKFKDQDI